MQIRLSLLVTTLIFNSNNALRDYQSKPKINDIFELVGEEFGCSPNRNRIVGNEDGHQ